MLVLKSTGKDVEASVEGKNTGASPGYLKENNIAIHGGFAANDTETVVFVIIIGVFIKWLLTRSALCSCG
jgi:hypothetical protein